LSGNTAYQVAVEFGDQPAADQLLQPRGSDELEVELTAPVDTIAAFWHEGQTVELTATVRNRGSTAQEVELGTASSHASVVMEGSTTISVGPAQAISLPVTAPAPADLRADLRLLLGVAAAGTSAATPAWATLAALCEAPPVEPSTFWPLRSSLLGRPNALWSGLGVVPSE